MNPEETQEEETPALSSASERNHGPQPLDSIMQALSLSSHDLVAASTRPFTHKAVARARKGRQLTPKMKVRITEALNALVRSRGDTTVYGVKQLFNY